jgi:hypothetical protein
VEVTEVGNQAPEDRKKAEIIRNISGALTANELGLQDVAKIANVIGQCLEHDGLTEQVLAFLKQAVQGLQQGTGEKDQGQP